MKQRGLNIRRPMRERKKIEIASDTRWRRNLIALGNGEAISWGFCKLVLWQSNRYYSIDINLNINLHFHISGPDNQFDNFFQRDYDSPKLSFIKKMIRQGIIIENTYSKYDK